MKSQTVYLDANFLVYCLVSKTPKLKRQARILLAKLLAKKAALALSPLTFDEAWEGIRKTIDITFSHFSDEIYLRLEEVTDQILSHPSFKVIQLKNAPKGVENALENIRKFCLRPRDAFHLAIIRSNDISVMVTSDKKFIDQQSSMGIEVVPIK